MIEPKVPVKVIFLITGLNTGGAEMMLLKICSVLNRKSFSPVVISLSNKGAVGPLVEALGIPVHSLDMKPSRPSLSGFLKLRKLISDIDPDLIQGWMYHGNLVACLIKQSRPMVWGIRQSLYELKRERVVTRLIIWLGSIFSRYPRFIVYNSRTSAIQHESFGFEKSLTKIIPNGFDTVAFASNESARSSIRAELGINEDKFLIGLVGRFHPMKDHQNFISAAALFLKEYPDAHFVLAGSGMEMSNTTLVEMIKRLNVGDSFSLLGERNDTAHLNAAFDVATSASAWGEGFANVVGEAMSCGVPCVVTDVGDSAWIVEKTGYVVPARDPVALASAWKKMLQMGIKQRKLLGEKARDRIILNFSLQSVVKQYEDLYKNLVAERGN